MQKIALFDIDGVLVRPGGYRAAVVATLGVFSQRMGVPGLQPGEENLGLLEAMGITNEWDMIPLLLAVALEQASAQGSAPTWQTLAEAMGWMRTRDWAHFQVDYAPALRRMQAYLTAGMPPIDAVRRGCEQQAEAGPLPQIVRQPLWQALFANKDRPDLCETTRVFQQYVLGSRNYQQNYQLTPEFETDSCLERYDQVAIAPAWASRLLQAREQKHLAMSFLTARPSLVPPSGMALGMRGSPEAELAAGQVGWQSLPMIGYGGARMLGRMLSLSPDYLLKPSPAQALAAVAAALGAGLEDALFWGARQYCASEGMMVNGRLPACRFSLADVPAALDLHIFEDSLTGILAVQKAAELLRGWGIRVDDHAWGVAVQNEKRARLLSLGAEVFADVNAALSRAFPDLEPVTAFKETDHAHGNE